MTSAVTVVTAFYSIPSKFNIAKYMEWAANFLQINAPVILFTEEEFTPLFRALRSNGQPLEVIAIPFLTLDTWKLYKDKWISEHAKDHEKHHHSPELYAIWAQKAWFVEKAIQQNPFQTEFFYWCDIGAFRGLNRPHPEFPQSKHLPRDKILFNSVASLTEKEQSLGPNADFTHVNRIVGGLWGGDKQGCLQWKAAFQAMLESYFSQGRFAGKDQSVMLSAYLANPSIAIVVKPTVPNNLFDVWFFQELLLSGQAQFEMDLSYTSKTPPVCVNLQGGLGNQMFQIATAYALAKRTGSELQIRREKLHADSRPQQYWDSILSAWKPYLVPSLPFAQICEERGPTWFTPLPTIIPDQGLLVTGYRQSSKYFAGAEEDIRRKMMASPELVQHVKKKWEWLLAVKEQVVVVHARRTDYLKAAAFHGPLPAEYYKQATAKMLETVENPIFLLVSDDPTFWSEIREHVPALQAHNYVVLQSANDVETLGLLQQFQYFILANSTFSWWFTWLAKATRVIAPTKWFGPCGPKPHEYEDIYEPEWIRL